MSIFFAEILHTGRAAIDMKDSKRDFSLKSWIRVSGMDLGVGLRPKLNFFQHIGTLHINLKPTTLAAAW